MEERGEIESINIENNSGKSQYNCFRKNIVAYKIMKK